LSGQQLLAPNLSKNGSVEFQRTLAAQFGPTKHIIPHSIYLPSDESDSGHYLFWVQIWSHVESKMVPMQLSGIDEPDKEPFCRNDPC